MQGASYARYGRNRKQSACLQFLYDLWWGHITPDTDFPKEVRRVLNGAFGELAARAQQTDLKRMLLM